MTGLRAAHRDATYHRNPDTRRGMDHESGHVYRWHVIGPNDLPMCAPRSNVVLFLEHTLPVAFVQLFQRCKRSGCRQAWPA